MGLNKPITVGGGLTAAEVQAIIDAQTTAIAGKVDAQTTAITGKVDEQTNTLKTDIPSSISGGASISDINAALDEKLQQYADGDSIHAIWLNDYKTYGENSYVFQNKDILHTLYNSKIAINDNNIYREAFQYVVDSGGHVGKFLKNAYGISDVGFDNLPTLESIKNNELAMSAIHNVKRLASLFSVALFDNGDQCIDITGGWTKTPTKISVKYGSKGSVGTQTLDYSFSGSSDKLMGYICANNDIDMSTFTICAVTFETYYSTVGSNDSGVYSVTPDIAINGVGISTLHKFDRTNIINEHNIRLEYDISDITGGELVVYSGYDWSYGCPTVNAKIAKIELY